MLLQEMMASPIPLVYCDGTLGVMEEKKKSVMNSCWRQFRVWTPLIKTPSLIFLHALHMNARVRCERQCDLVRLICRLTKRQ